MNSEMGMGKMKLVVLLLHEMNILYLYIYFTEKLHNYNNKNKIYYLIKVNI